MKHHWRVAHLENKETVSFLNQNGHNPHPLGLVSIFDKYINIQSINSINVTYNTCDIIPG